MKTPPASTIAIAANNKVSTKSVLPVLGIPHPVPTIVGVHSVVLVDGTTVNVIYDIEPDVSGSGLHFEFELPALVSRDDLRAFGEWLASSGFTGTVH